MFGMDRENAFVGQSSSFLDVVEQASAAAALNRPVLVIGERGTGKELIAERLHRLSPRWGGPYVVMNCAALPETLIEAELFGHEAGAFTGATKQRHGRFEEADGGTLFLDELGTLSMAAQERLLRAVEYGEVTRIGSSRPIRIDVRIVAATNENLPARCESGHFRSDLLDRLSFEVLTLPPLRSREGDVAVLADYFGRRMASELRWDRWPGFGASAVAAMEGYGWPGNVRELRNVCERAVYRWADATRPVQDLVFDPFASLWQPSGGKGRDSAHEDATDKHNGPTGGDDVPMPDHHAVDDLRSAVDAYEKRILEDALSRCRFNQKITADALGLSYDQLRHALKRHKLL